MEWWLWWWGVWWQCVRESLVDKEALVEDLLQDKARLEGKVATLGGQLAAEKTEAKTAQVSITSSSCSSSSRRRSTRSWMGWAAGPRRRRTDGEEWWCVLLD